MMAVAVGKTYALMGVALAIFVVLLLLDVVLRREWVKQNLPQGCARYLSIRWAPFAPGWGVYWHPGFRVTYVDTASRVHQAYCRPRGITCHAPLVWLCDKLLDV